ncbi:MORN repeat-containing protein [Plasmodiophora brassicae]|uniref:MORN repeat-containing protein n=1 Tax=Plasmodiophora brassicae TaxID=37360 RepID=A0A0G4IUD3_PLABS|nr:hypothetical protein PBRA_006815 [Plasmodiophora brassicae]SPR00839.1 unnamed protein product [Plasmodiophora brassicae]
MKAGGTIAVVTLSAIAAVIAGTVRQPQAAGQEDGLRRPAQQLVASPPQLPVPAVCIDERHWRRLGSDWVHNTEGFTYGGDVIQQWNGAAQVKVPHGCGRFTVPGQRTYSGQWHNGRRHGEGRYLTTDGSYSYRGRYKCGRQDGYGVACHADGWRYKGHWVNDKRHGQGKWSDTGGQVLKGQWRQGWFEGRGRAVLSDGRTLDGGFASWAPRADTAIGMFRGQVVDEMGHVTRLDEWTPKCAILNMPAASRKRQRDNNDDDDDDDDDQSLDQLLVEQFKTESSS